MSTAASERTGTGLDFLQRVVARELGELRAEGRVIQGGRKMAYCEAKLTDAAGKLLVHGTGTCLVFPR